MAKKQKPKDKEPKEEELRTKLAKAKMIEAMKKSAGIVLQACKMAGVARAVYYKWFNTDEEFKAEIENIGEESLDFVESKLFELINGVHVQVKTQEGHVVYKKQPCKTSIIFYLKTKGKKRGYIERKEFTGLDGQPLGVQKDIEALSDEDLELEYKKSLEQQEGQEV